MDHLERLGTTGADSQDQEAIENDYAYCTFLHWYSPFSPLKTVSFYASQGTETATPMVVIRPGWRQRRRATSPLQSRQELLPHFFPPLA
jgi:hypothetical protein